MSEAAPAASEKPKGGGKSKLLLIIGLVVLLLGGGGGGYWFFVMKPAAAAAEAAAAAVEEDGEGEHGEGADKKSKKKAKKAGDEGESAALKFDPFVVNLADEGGTRYLRLGLSLVIEGGEAEAKELEEGKVKLLRIRSAVLDLLSQQVADTVVTAEGKQHLKEAIEEAATEILEPMEVTDVLFTEFVVQF
jgi:flagellar FliL protein